MTLRCTHLDHDLLLAKAGALIEALPWIGQLADETVVIKYSGNTMIDDDLKRAFAGDIVFLRRVGLKPVIVHGGGPQINSTLEQFDITSEFRGDLRVITSEAMGVVCTVLVGQVDRGLMGLINAHSPFAVGMSGENGRLLRVRRRGLVGGGGGIDLGFTGGVDPVDPSVPLDLVETGHIFAVATVALGPDGQIYNANVNTVASTLVLALEARRLIMFTDATRLYANCSGEPTIISSITPGEVHQLIPDLTSEMVPKVEACARTVEGGMCSITIIDGRAPYCLLLEIFTDDEVGIMVCEESV